MRRIGIKWLLVGLLAGWGSLFVAGFGWGYWQLRQHQLAPPDGRTVQAADGSHWLFCSGTNWWLCDLNAGTVERLSGESEFGPSRLALQEEGEGVQMTGSQYGDVELRTVIYEDGEPLFVLDNRSSGRTSWRGVGDEFAGLTVVGADPNGRGPVLVDTNTGAMFKFRSSIRTPPRTTTQD